MYGIDNILQIVTIAAISVGLLGTSWAVVRALYRHYSRFLFFSGCHLLPLTLRDDIVKQSPQLEDALKEHAYKPLIVLPMRQMRYLRVKDGGRVLLKFKPPHREDLVVMAYAYSYPEDPTTWDLFDQPAISLVLRRYVGIERPLLGSEDVIPDGWRIIEHGITRHGRKELALLHRMSAKSGKLIWLVAQEYSARFWLPEKGAQGANYQSEWEDGWFLEYAGIALQISKPSILSIQS